MALQQILKVPMSRFLGASISSYSNDFKLFSSKSLTLFARWAKAPMHQPVRSFAASSSEKIKVQRKKRRLDEVCLERFQQYSRNFIQSWITQGKVFVDGKVVNKCGTPVSDKAVVEIKAEVPKYVCRAGYKLEAAIEQLEIDVTGKVALDSGLSTGGFTDCLLQYGASFVYGVDVGYGQVADKIRRDDRVKVIERTNLRYLSELPQKVDLATLDLSFISILTVMPAVLSVMKDDATLVTLIKPQFEAHRSQVGGGGIVRDPLVHQEVLAKIINGVQDFGLECKGWIESPLKGADGNKEFLACFSRTATKDPDLSAAKADIVKLHRRTQSTEPVI
ncbi:putative rRNA methyltransferase YqxC [Sesamum alatum]|uniref:rRNA methyltransferase YqxC n=1 Tax=Sesamum alatum TaxID=300844 RepID=A0AAE1XXE5_9LAMI|nr:putative rRNA methyltransferase YqxC [Sesamum alatum]